MKYGAWHSTEVQFLIDNQWLTVKQQAEFLGRSELSVKGKRAWLYKQAKG